MGHIDILDDISFSLFVYTHTIIDITAQNDSIFRVFLLEKLAQYFRELFLFFDYENMIPEKTKKKCVLIDKNRRENCVTVYLPSVRNVMTLPAVLHRS